MRNPEDLTARDYFNIFKGYKVILDSLTIYTQSMGMDIYTVHVCVNGILVFNSDSLYRPDNDIIHKGPWISDFYKVAAEYMAHQLEDKEIKRSNIVEKLSEYRSIYK